jgi:flap endonuclease-1
MGVNISDIVPHKSIDLAYLSGKKIAVDAFNTIYQFLSIIRQRDGASLMDSKGNVTSHLAGLFYRNTNLLASGIKPCYVFDGEPPALKSDIKQERAARKEEAREKLIKARAAGDEEGIRRYSQQTAILTEDIIKESKMLLKAMGIPYIQAPGEGEAQAAHMCKSGDFFATASQDYDSLLFGSPRVVKNINVTGKRKMPGRQEYREITPEIMELDLVLKELGITSDQLIILGILVGTDYNPGGIKGIGPKKALKLVKEHKDLSVFSHVEWKFSAEPEKIFNIFKNPKVTSYDTRWEEIDKEAVSEILVENHEFAQSRIDSAIEKITGRKGNQSSLSNFI